MLDLVAAVGATTCRANGQVVPCPEFVNNFMNGFSAVLPLFFLVYVAIIILLVVSMWKIFTKAGKPGWASIIPIYNAIVLLEITGKPIWWIILFFIPIVNIVAIIFMYDALAKSFGKTSAYTVGLVLLSIVFIPMLAFDGSVYNPNGMPQSPTPVVPPVVPPVNPTI